MTPPTPTVAADTRLSAQVYLQMSDVERVGDLVLQLLEEAAECRRMAAGGGSNSSSARLMVEAKYGCDWVVKATTNATAQQQYRGEKRRQEGDGSCASQFL